MLWCPALQARLFLRAVLWRVGHAPPQQIAVTHLPSWEGGEGRVARVTQLLLGAAHFRAPLGHSFLKEVPGEHQQRCQHCLLCEADTPMGSYPRQSLASL